MHQVSELTIHRLSQVSAMEPWVEDLRDLMPKAITLPPHDAGVEGIHLIFLTAMVQIAVNTQK